MLLQKEMIPMSISLTKKLSSAFGTLKEDIRGSRIEKKDPNIFDSSKAETKASKYERKLAKLEKKYPDRFKALKPMLKEDNGNIERLFFFLKRLKSLKRAFNHDTQSKIQAFTLMLESDCKTTHDVAILIGIFGQVAFLKSALESYPDLMNSKYANHLIAAVGGEKLAYDVSGNKTSDGYFGEIDIFISLEDFGITKEKVILVDCLEIPTVSLALNELAKDGYVSIYFMYGKKYLYSYLSIASSQRIYVFDLRQINPMNQEPIVEQSRASRTLEFKNVLLNFLAKGEVTKFLSNGSQFRKFLKKGIGCKKWETQECLSFVDRRLTFFQYQKEQKKGQELQYAGIDKKIDDQYHEFIEANFARPFNRGAEISNWDLRPENPYQLHFLALSPYILLRVYDVLDKIQFPYEKYKNFHDFQAKLREYKIKTSLKKKEQKLNDFAKKMKNKIFGST